MPLGKELVDEINAVNLDKGTGAFWWLGQLGYAIKIAGKKLYFDPYLFEGEKRLHPPVFKPEDVIDADIIFGSHDHIDHIDHSSWKQFAESSPKAVFVCSKAHVENLSEELEIDINRFVGLDDGGSAVVKGIETHAIAAAHEFLESDSRGYYPHLSYVIKADEKTIFFSGDSCIYDGYIAKIAALGHMDIMFVPINGRDAYRFKINCIGNMTYQEAVDLVGTLKTSFAVPGHYEMFAHNSEDPRKFVQYLNAKYPGIRTWVGGYGERVEF